MPGPPPRPAAPDISGPAIALPPAPREHPGSLRFDVPVAPNGYAWWYADAVSDDGSHALTAIAFVGSVFSPYYAFARRHGDADPLAHCAINVALYGRPRRWAMTERGRGEVICERDALVIGPSFVQWRGDALEFHIDEVTVPRPSRLRGVVRVVPAATTATIHVLDPLGRHEWRPIAPVARVEVDLERPALRWSGHGYLDSNRGAEPLERGFARWHWSRAALRGGAFVAYDATPRHGPPVSLALRFDAAGGAEHVAAPPTVRLPRTLWGVEREARADLMDARVLATWVDAPFYARTLVGARLAGEEANCVHESLSLDRFAAPWVQALLPFRMPRAAGRVARG